MTRNFDNNYKVIKTALKNITSNFRNSDGLSVQQVIEDAVYRIHIVRNHVFMFLRLWILHKVNAKEDIPLLTDSVINIAFKVLMTDSSAGPKTTKNLNIENEFKEFYNNVYAKLGYSPDKKINRLNLSCIINYLKIEIVTAIENNIKLNFLNYVRRFVNSAFKNDHQKDIENTINKYQSLINKKKNIKDLKKHKNNELRELKKQQDKDLSNIKNDLINKNDIFISHKKYHNWINKHRQYIFPKNVDVDYQIDIENNPQKYLPNMIYICKQLQLNKTKLFQFFPLGKNMIPKHIPIDSPALIDLLYEQNTKNVNTMQSKAETLKNQNGEYEKIWEQCFTIKDKKEFKMKNYEFDKCIITDGISVSIRFIHKSDVEKKKEKHKNMKNGRKIVKNMTKEQKEEYYKNKENEKKEKNEKAKKDRQKYRDDFKKLPKEEKDKIKQNKKKVSEFIYLDELSDEKLNSLKDAYLLYVDPGKKNLLYIMSNDGRFLRYTNRRYLKETKRLVYNNKVQNYKDRNGLSNIEFYLTDFNSKTCDIEEFKLYIKRKIEVSEVLLDMYKAVFFRKINLYRYIQKCRAESNLIKIIKEIFEPIKIPINKNNLKRKKKSEKIIIQTKTTQKKTNKVKRKNKQRKKMIKRKKKKNNRKKRSKYKKYKIEEKTDTEKNKIIMIYGDYSTRGNKMKNFISTPNLRIKRLLHKVFEIYDFDEYGTSKYNCKTFGEQNNLYLMDNNKDKTKRKFRKMHSILTYKMENGRLGCINRDNNSTINYKQITEHYLETRERLSPFKRESKKVKKDTNTKKAENIKAETEDTPKKVKTVNKKTENVKVEIKDKPKKVKKVKKESDDKPNNVGKTKKI